MSEGSQGVDQQLLVLLGEIKGELGGIRSQIKATTEATNKRIDDLSDSVKEQTAALNRRIDDHQNDVDSRFGTVDSRLEGVEKEQRINRRNAVVAGSAASAVVATTAEIIKAVLN